MLVRRLNLGYTVPNDLPRKGNERMVIPMKKMLAMLLAVLTCASALPRWPRVCPKWTTLPSRLR